MASSRQGHHSSVIAVDIDNVIADTDQTVRQIIEREYGIHAEREDITSWRYADSLPLTPHQEEQVLSILHSDLLGSIPEIAGAAHGLRILGSIAPVWLLTARPDSTRDDTQTWLSSIDAPYEAIIFTSSKLDIPARALFYIDDNAETASQLLAASQHVFLMDKPWNRRVPLTPRLFRVQSWTDVTRNALNLASLHRWT